MIAILLTKPEQFAVGVDSSEALWGAMLGLAHVIAGFIGLVGLLRVLTLPRRERPKRHRLFTIEMVAVGLATLLMFNHPIGLPDFSDGSGVVAFVIVTLLPLTGAAWLLAKSWRFLLAGPTGSDDEEPS